MNQFSLLNYLLILLAIFAHYPYGKRLGIKSFFSATLVGVSISGLVVGALANFCAGLIRPFLVIWVALGLILLGSELKSFFYNRLADNKKIKLYLLLVFAGILLLIFNIPSKVFTTQDREKQILLFNRHYSYYASQSIEMLNADYFDRLKIANLYPFEWSQYHFFNSGTQASAQTLIRHPSLFSYWIAQALIGILILLSIFEALLLTFGLRTKNVLLFIALLIIGFTLFSDSITWNLISTGPFSIFAIFMLVLAMYKRRYREAIIYLGVLGCSAFRLLPISGLFLLATCYYLFKQFNPIQKINITNILSTIRAKTQLKISDFLVIFLATFYNIITFTSAKPIESMTLIANKVFDKNWANTLIGYKLVGLPYYLLFRNKIYSSYNATGFYDKVFLDPTKRKLLIIIVIISCALLIRWLNKIYRDDYHKFNKWFLLALIISINYFYISADVLALHLLTLFYILLSLVLCYLIRKKDQKSDGFFSGQILALILLGLLFQYVGLDFGVREPVLYIFFDVLLWSLICLYIFVYRDSKKVFFSMIILSSIFLYLFNLKLPGMFKLTETDKHNIKVEFTPLSDKSFNRSDYVDKNNFLKPIFEDSDNEDFYSSAIGAKLKYTPDHKTFLNYRFMKE